MRILHLIWTMTGGGAERQLEALAPELARRGQDVHVAFVHPSANAEWPELSHCTLHHVPARGKYDITPVPRVLLLARRLRPDVIHTWLTYMDVIGGATARLLRVAWVVSERSASLSYPPTLLNRMRVAVAQRADLIVPNSAGGAEYWRERNIDLSRIEIVPNFVPAMEIAAAAPLEDPRVTQDDELVIHVGRLSAEKNIETLIAAMAHVCRERPRAKLALCGDGPLRAHLEAEVRAAGLEERVVFAGFVPHVASWLKRSSAAVAVSRCEGHPNAVLEAIAAGVPVVLSDIPAYKAILDEESASFVPLMDVRALAAAIVTTLDARASALRRAMRARAAIVTLSLDAMTTRYESIYRRAIEIAARRRYGTVPVHTR